MIALAGLLVAVAPVGTARGAPAPPATGGIGQEPYRIEAHVNVLPATRIDARGREVLLATWRTLVQRFVGAPWELTIAEEGSADPATPLEAFRAEDFAPPPADRDKVWMIRVDRDGAGYALSGREFDVLCNRLGPIRRLSVPVVADLPRALLEFTVDLFCPTAEIVGQSGGGATLNVRGAGLEPASPVGRVVASGTVFLPIRIVTTPEKKSRYLTILYTYLRVSSVSGSEAQCSIQTGVRDPLTRRFTSRNRLVALGAKPGDQPTRLRFVTRGDRAPAAGYVLTARGLPHGVAREVGTTDREGRIVLEPGFASGLVALRLLAGSVEPMVELPLMPGASSNELTIPFEPLPATVTLETQLDSLRDAVIDLVAIRARLEGRMKAREQGEDWDGLAATLKEYNALTPRATYADRLTRLKEDASREQARTKKPILTRTAQAQISEVQNLIDRYLTDDEARAYAAELDRVRGEAAAAARKAAAKRKAVPRAAAP